MGSFDDLIPGAPAGPFDDLVPKRGAIEEIATAAKRGLYEGVKGAGAVLQAPAEIAREEPGAISRFGQKMEAYGKEQAESPELKAQPEAHGGVTNFLSEAAAAPGQALPLLASTIPAASAGAAIGSAVAPGPGTVAGAVGGAVASGLAGGSTVALQTYHEKYHEGLEKGLTDDKARDYAAKSAALQGTLMGAVSAVPFAGPAVRTAVGAAGKTAGEAAADVAGKRFLPEMGKSAAELAVVNTGLGVAGAAGQSTLDTGAGLEAPGPLEAAKAAFLPSLAGAVGFLPLGAYGAFRTASESGKVRRALADPATPTTERLRAALAVHAAIDHVDPAAAAEWDRSAAEAIHAGEPVALDGSYAKREAAPSPAPGEIIPQAPIPEEPIPQAPVSTVDPSRGPLSTAAAISEQGTLPAFPFSSEEAAHRSIEGREAPEGWKFDVERHPSVVNRWAVTMRELAKEEKDARALEGGAGSTDRAAGGETSPGADHGGGAVAAEVPGAKGGEAPHVDALAHEAATSPLNPRREPTDKEKAAGNYKMGHVEDLANLPHINVENPAGSIRRSREGVEPAWESLMHDHYGYFRGTQAADSTAKRKQGVDVFVKAGTPRDWKGEPFVVDQVNPTTGKFDEHKVIVGADSIEDAREIYRRNYAAGWKGAKTIRPTTIEGLKAWLKHGDKTKPFVDHLAEQKQLADTKAERATEAGWSAFREDDGTWTLKGPEGETQLGYVSKREALDAARMDEPTGRRVVYPDTETQALIEKNDQEAQAAKEPIVAPAPKTEPDRFAKNKVFTSEKVDAARERLRKKLGTLRSGIDPELFADGVTIAGAHIEAGLRDFASYAKAMLDDFGDRIKPYLLSFYEGVRHFPGIDNEGMTPTEEAKSQHEAMLAPKQSLRDTVHAWWDALPAPERLKVQERAGVRASYEKVASNMIGEGTLAKLYGAREEPLAKPQAGAENEPHEPVVEQPGRTAEPGGVPGPRESVGVEGREPGGHGAGGDLGHGVAGEGARGGESESAYPAGHELRPGARAGGEPSTGAPESSDARNSRAGRPPAQTAANAATGNFEITGELDRASFAPKSLFRSNVEAIRLLKKLEEQRRGATAEEQSILAGYIGWGGMKQAFDPKNADWAREYAQLKDLLSPDEHAAANRSILDAHYTSRTVADGVWSALMRMGFDGGRVLEPSMGTGNFFGLMPAELRASAKLHGVELDRVTGGIAKLLYPKATIHAPRGFNDLKLAPDSFDLAIGNPPFGDQSIFDANHKEISKFKIHAFFFAKALDTVRPGGILGMVVSKGLLDAADPNGIAARKYLAERAELVGAIRLPNTAFKTNANTEVTTDLVFLRKLAPGERGNAEKWAGLATIKAGEHDIDVNQYFADHPDMMLGTMGMTGTMYRANTPTLEPRENQNLAADLAEAIAKLPARVMREATRAAIEGEKKTNEKALEAAADLKPYNYFMEGGKLFLKHPDNNGEPVVQEMAHGGVTLARMKALVEVRDAARSLITAEASEATGDPALKIMRGNLNKVYDAFVKKFGLLNQDANKRAFREDADAMLLLALEKNFDKGVSLEIARKSGQTARPVKADKADIFSKRTINPVRAITSASSAKDAMFASLNERGRIDPDYMARLYKKPPGEILKELGDLVYKDPDQGYVTRDAYLSGNVKEKLARAEAEAERDPEAFARNVESLRAVQPPDKKAADIFVQLGSTWIPEAHYKQFVRETIEGDMQGMFAAALGKFVGLKIHSTNDALNRAKYGTQRASAGFILERLLANKPPIVHDLIKVGDQEKAVVNQEETAAAQGKAEELQAAFQDWIWKAPERREALARIYNDRFNTHVKRDFDGSHMSFPGMNRNIDFRPHQSAMVYRGLQDRNLLANHVVGAGKTFAFASLAMEMRRLGFAKKPMITVPNHLVLEWAKQFKLLYPAANLLAATRKDFEKSNRKQLFSKIATGDWDAVVVAHSSFGFIPVPPEKERALLEEQKADIVEAIEAAKKEQGKRFNTRDLEKAKERVDAKIERLAERKQDNIMDFGEMGVDALMVDEAQEFKNLFYTTSMTGVSGLGDPAGSTKAFDMFVKTQYVQEQNAGKNVFFATGTPVANTIAEIFHMQRYLQMGDLKARAIHQFDAWANTFGRAVTDWVMDAAGRFKQKTRFSEFQNLKELKQLWNAVTDTVTRQDLIDDAKKQGKVFPLPKLAGGKPNNIVAERSPRQAEYIGIPRPVLDEHGEQAVNKETGVPEVKYDEGTIIDRLDHWQERVKKNPREMPLVITGDARKAGLDFRLIDPNAEDFPGSKVNLAVAEIHRIWKANDHRKGTQLVFIDLSTPKSAKGKATADAAERTPTFFIKEGGVNLKHVPGVKTTLVAAPDDSFFSYKDDRGRYTIVDSVSGLRVGTGATKQEAIDTANSRIGDTGVDRFREISKRDAIDPGDISDYVARWEDERAAKEPEKAAGEEQEVSMDELLADQGGDFSVYDDIRQKLHARGIPPEQIAFIHEYDTDLQKEALFEAMNNGSKRILLGSTKKMGAGTNVQRKLVAKHDLDSPWRPADLEQRDGRIIRQGNEFYEEAARAGNPDTFEVEIHRYATERTYDARMWEIIEQKARSIETFHSRDDLDTIEDVGSESANAAEMKAGASGDPRILESIQLNAEIKKLQAQERSWKRSRYDLEESVQKTQKKEGYPWTAIEHFEAVKDIAPEKGAATTIDFDGKTYPADKPGQEFADHWVRTVSAIMEASMRPQVLGHYRGFDIIGESHLKSPRFALAAKGFEIGSTIYSADDKFSPSGFVQRLDDQIRKIPARLTELNALAQRREHEAQQAKDELAKDFPRADDLAQMRSRQRDLIQALRTPVAKKVAPTDGASEARLSRTEEPAPVYYSDLARKLEALPQKAGDAAQWRGVIDNLKGVKADEIEWSGVKDWLAMQPGKISKDQVQAYLRDNGVKVEETILGGKSESLATSEVNQLKVELDAMGYDVTDDAHEDIFGVLHRPTNIFYSDTDGDARDLFPTSRHRTLEDLPPEVREKVDRLGGILEMAQDPYNSLNDDETHFSRYTLPGGENYRELLLTLPSRDKRTVSERLGEPREVTPGELADLMGSDPEAFEGLKAALVFPEADDVYIEILKNGRYNVPIGNTERDFRTREEAMRYLHAQFAEPEGAVAPGPDFRSPHFDQPNILAHVRFDERTDAEGKRVLFIEEIQSDWAQKGKRAGFQPKDMPRTKDSVAREVYGSPYAELDAATRSAVDAELDARLNPPDRGAAGAGPVPNAPFVGKTEAWVALAVKRMIRYAADNGFDRVAYTTGEQQADRYDLSKHIGELHVMRYTDAVGNVVPGQVHVDGFAPGGSRVAVSQTVTEKDLPDVIGKDLAERALKDLAAQPSGERGRPIRYSGLDLKVGGEGMRAFYDKIVPNVVNDVLKKLGGGRVAEVRFGKTEGVKVPAREIVDAAMEYMDGKITPDELRERAGVEDYTDAQIEAALSYNPDGGRARAREYAHEFARDVQQRNAGQKRMVQPGFDITPAMREAVLGGVPMFKQGEASAGERGTVDVRAVAERLGVQAKFAETEADLPEHLRGQIERESAVGKVRGVFDPRTGDVWLVGANIHSEGEAAFVALHESAHRGLVKLFGADLRPVLEQIFRSNESVQEKARALMLKYHYDQARATEEVLADMALRGQARNLKGWEHFVAFLREWLVKRGFNLKFSDDMAEYIAGAAAHAGKEEAHIYADGESAKFQRAYHGSPHDFEKFSTEKIGSGEGAQAYGYGLYFAGKREVAQHYKDALAKQFSPTFTSAPYLNPGNDGGKTRASLLKLAEALRASTQRPPLDKRSDRVTVADFLGHIAATFKFDRNYHQDFVEDVWSMARDGVPMNEAIDRVLTQEAPKAGRLYEVELAPKEEEYLDWDKPLGEQLPMLGAAGAKVRDDVVTFYQDNPQGGRRAFDFELQNTGSQMYHEFAREFGATRRMAAHVDGGYDISYNDDKAASAFLASIGIPGIKYLDGSSRRAGEGQHNYVIFDDKHVEVKAKFSRGEDKVVPEDHPFVGYITKDGASESFNEADAKRADYHHSFLVKDTKAYDQESSLKFVRMNSEPAYTIRGESVMDPHATGSTAQIARLAAMLIERGADPDAQFKIPGMGMSKAEAPYQGKQIGTLAMWAAKDRARFSLAPAALFGVAAKLREGLSDERKQQEIARGGFRAALATLERNVGTTDAALDKARQAVDAIAPAERWKAMYEYQTGGAKAVGDEKLRPIFQAWKENVDERARKIQDWDEGYLKEVLPNYFSQMWKDPAKALEWYQRMMGKGPLEGGKSFLKKRAYATYREGMSWKVFDDQGGARYFQTERDARAAAGVNDLVKPPLEPVSQNFIDIAQLSLQQMDKFIAMHEFRQWLKEEKGWVKIVRRGETPPAGYAKVDDPAFRSMAVFPVTDPETGKIGAAAIHNDYMVPALIARDLNNYLDKGLYRFGLWKNFRYAENLMLSARLGFSAFHAGFTTMDTLVSHTDVGARYLLQGDIAKALATWGKAITSPISAPLEGRKLLKQFYGQAASDLNTRAILEFLTEGGARGRMNATDFNNSWASLRRAWSDGNIKETAWHALPALMEGVMRPIMHHLVPWQKMTARVLLAKFELDRIAQSLGKEKGDYARIVNALGEDAKRQIAYRVVQQVDDRLGQVAYDNLFWNRFAKDIAQASIQSVGWNVGTANVILGGMKDVGKVFKPEALLGPLDRAGKVSGDLGRVTGRLSYLISLNLTVGMMGAALNYLLTGEDAKDLRDYFFPRTGRKNPDGSDERISMPSYIKDEYALAHHPVTTVQHKLHPFFSMTAELLKNEDFYGTQIVNKDDPWTKMAAQAIAYLGKSIQPYAVQNLQQNRAKGETGPMSAAPFIGITPAPASVSRTPFEAYVAERYASAFHHTQTPEGAEKAQARRDAIAALKAGRAPELAPFTPAERMSIFTAARTPIQEQRFNRLSIQEKLSAWERATPAERELFHLKAALAKDFMRHQATMEPEARAKAMEILRGG